MNIGKNRRSSYLALEFARAYLRCGVDKLELGQAKEIVNSILGRCWTSHSRMCTKSCVVRFPGSRGGYKVIQNCLQRGSQIRSIQVGLDGWKLVAPHSLSSVQV